MTIQRKAKCIVEGGAKTEGFYTEFGKWHLDATMPPPGAPLTPNTIYYDNPDADNDAAARAESP